MSKQYVNYYSQLRQHVNYYSQLRKVKLLQYMDNSSIWWVISNNSMTFSYLNILQLCQNNMLIITVI
jgi:hypothetical protein